MIRVDGTVVEYCIKWLKNFQCDANKGPESDDIVLEMSQEVILHFGNDLWWVNKSSDIQYIFYSCHHIRLGLLELANFKSYYWTYTLSS